MNRTDRIEDYRSSLDDPASRRYGTFSYLPEMSAGQLREQISYMIARGWAPAVEHVEVERAADDYWYMWKLPMFGERDIDLVLAEVGECHAAWPDHLVRLVGYDNRKQSQGLSVVVHRPG